MFFIDKSQRVTLQDIGEIRKWAEEANVQITEMELVSQFRSNGADRYLAWPGDTLEIRDTANFDIADIDYDIRILDSPMKMQEFIIERNHTSHNRARFLASYCWNLIMSESSLEMICDMKTEGLLQILQKEPERLRL